MMKGRMYNERQPTCNRGSVKKLACNFFLILGFCAAFLSTTQMTHAAPVATSSVGDRIVAAARSQLGYHEGANNCNKFGPCEPWCALFASWAWRRGGINFSTSQVRMFYAYGQRRGTLHHGLSNPRPGDAILFHTSGGTGRHMGIIERIDSNGKITSIEGNYGNKVTEVGPYDPVSRHAYAIVSPR